MLGKSAAMAAVVTLGFIGAAEARDQIRIVGSSTVFPFSTTVAEEFGKVTSFKTPIVESTGSGGGLKLFCGGIGARHPDITNASRRIKASEVKRCARNGIKDIVAKDVPTGNGKTVPNPHKTWKDVNPALPATRIEVLGPPPTSGTRDAFVELAMEGGCKKFPWVKALKKTNKQAYKALCHTIREDGTYIEAGENDNLIVQKLVANPNALGIFGYSFLDQNTDRLQGGSINGQAPAFERIAAGKYPLSRPLFFYVKKAHIGMIPGIREFIVEFTTEKTWGPEGYLAEKGLIPMPSKERSVWSTKVRALQNLAM
jgi:phosphate transport system substrate-binding protein